jgi:hypothetical protein
VAPSQETSFSTPYVSGAATILLQAAKRGDGGGNISDAADARTIKALLLNGAIKPYDWVHTTNAPLDTRYGAGVLNVDQSYMQLAAGEHAYSASDSSANPESANPIASLQGWDFESLASGPLNATVNHYCFNATHASAFTFTATLVWERAAGATGVDQLTLALYDSSNATLVAQSVSTVDNVQHLYLPCRRRL